MPLNELEEIIFSCTQALWKECLHVDGILKLGGIESIECWTSDRFGFELWFFLTIWGYIVWLMIYISKIWWRGNNTMYISSIMLNHSCNAYSFPFCCFFAFPREGWAEHLPLLYSSLSCNLHIEAHPFLTPGNPFTLVYMQPLFWTNTWSALDFILILSSFFCFSWFPAWHLTHWIVYLFLFVCSHLIFWPFC